ncbi:MAG TPA: hypothetical protein VHQ24_10600 [Lachnospiraceae bacterium]|nr:hypothetical protein [Lachnospiraceae bacterium]
MPSNKNSKSSGKTNKNSNKNMGKSSKSSQKVVTVRNTMHLFYMVDKKTDIGSIMECLLDQTSIVVQIWESMGVAQVEMNDKDIIDFEDNGLSFSSKEDIQFIEKHNIQTVFEVTLDESDFTFAKQLFNRMVTSNGGFFCTDSDDFTPIYAKSDLEA